MSVDAKNSEKSIPAKKRSYGRKGKTPTKKTTLFTSSEETENDEDADDGTSSHEEWNDEEVKPRRVVKKTSKPKPDFWECETCDMKFTERRRYRRHLDKHKVTKLHECKMCDKKFKCSSSLKNHFKQNHDENPPIYSCTMCDYSTKTPYGLQEHFTRKHTEEYKYECNICGKHFKTERDYKSHMSNHDDGPQICDICGISYPSKLSLSWHRYYKHTEKSKPFECTLCKKRLCSEKNLEAHMLQHNQTYVCELCGMKFARRGRLSTHRKIHAEKTRLCPICGRAFTTDGTLRIHMITHTGAKSYSCDVCGLSYTQRSALLLHWRKKHPEATEPPPPVKLPKVGDFMKLASAN